MNEAKVGQYRIHVPWRRKWQATPVFWTGKFHEQRVLEVYSLWDFKELDMTEHAHIQII